MDKAKKPGQTDNNSEEVIAKKQEQVEETEDTLETEEYQTETEEPSETDKLMQELNEVKDKHLRLYSEFENYRRRTAKERLNLINSANADLMLALLPILDDFERAREAAENSESNTDLEGMNLIYQKLMTELKNKGLKPMEDPEGKSFDAEIHEAISQAPAPQKKLKNRIVHVIEKGYYLNDKVLRHAKVVIGT